MQSEWPTPAVVEWGKRHRELIQEQWQTWLAWRQASGIPGNGKEWHRRKQVWQDAYAKMVAWEQERPAELVARLDAVFGRGTSRETLDLVRELRSISNL